MNVSARAGMHRIMWDLRYQPLTEGGGRGGNAIPRRTYPSSNAPWAPPGNYTVRLTANGKTYTQPIAVHLDPRVKTPALTLTTLHSMTRDLYTGAKAAKRAADRARALNAKLEGVEGAQKLREDLSALAPAAPAGGGGRGFGGGRGGRGGGAPAAPTLDSVSASLLAAAMAMQGAEAAPTAREVTAANEAKRQSTALMAKWTRASTVDLAAVNAKRKAAGQPPIVIDDAGKGGN
jgi:hypothetical protein